MIIKESEPDVDIKFAKVDLRNFIDYIDDYLKVNEVYQGFKCTNSSITVEPDGNVYADYTFMKGYVIFFIKYDQGKLSFVSQYDFTLTDSKIKDFGTWLFNLNIDGVKYYFDKIQDLVNKLNIDTIDLKNYIK